MDYPQDLSDHHLPQALAAHLSGPLRHPGNEEPERRGTTDVDRRLGERVKGLRLARGMSQQAVADALGVSAQQVQKYERGINRISVSTLLVLARGLGVSPHTLLGALDHAPGEDLPMTQRERALLLDTYARIGSPKLRQQVLHLLAEMSRPEAA